MNASPVKSSRAVGALEILEEAFHLLRRCPPAYLASYYLGAVPFTLGFLFFWADMSHGVDTRSRLFPGAMALALLYLFMKCMHSGFARQLKTRLTGDQIRRLSAGKIIRLVAFQSICQPLGFVVLPVALLFTVPFGWCFAFFQNATVFGLEDGEIKEIRQRAWRQALIWPVQNNLLLGIMLLFSFFIMINLLIAAALLPHLFKTIFGIETVFSRSGFHLLNTTFFMTVTLMTYLCVDPVIKAVYVLRCYYGEARKSGEDLETELRTAQMKRNGVLPAVMVIITCALLLASPSTARSGTDAGGVEGVSGITTQQLEEAVGNVLGRVEYTWRTPRDKTDKPPPSGFWYELLQTLRRWAEAVSDWIEKIIEWIMDLIRKLLPKGGHEATEQTGWSGAGYAMIYLLLALGACAAVILIKRLILSRRAGIKEPELKTPLVKAADLEDESVRADALPEDEWMAMARNLLETGETRLAVRALYLAALAHLAAAGLITVADYKSDREYERELQSRGESVYGMALSFSNIKAGFEAVWYGMHDVSRSSMDFFMDNHRQVMSHAVR